MGCAKNAGLLLPLEIRQLITEFYKICRLSKPFKRGVFCLSEKQFTKAITEFDTAIEFSPTHAEVLRYDIVISHVASYQ